MHVSFCLRYMFYDARRVGGATFKSMIVKDGGEKLDISQIDRIVA